MPIGRRPHDPDSKDRKMVVAMASFGITEADIASVIDIDVKTLRKHYRTELDTAHVKANLQVAQSLFEKCLGSGPQAVTACIFWCKTRMGWRDPASVTQIISKKEEFKWAAKSAGIGTEWGEDLVAVPPSNEVN